MILLGLIGHPVSHSLSPLMHNLALDYMGIRGVYLPLDVSPEDLENAVRGARSLGFSGLNVTMPHKTAVLRYVNEASDEVRICGAANTLKISKRKISAFNTDVDGVIRSVEDLGEDLGGKTAIVFGAGGAARAVLLALSKLGISKVTIANRTISKAEELSRIARDRMDLDSSFCSLEDGVKLATNHDIIVNATSVGMKEDESILESKDIRRGVLVIDMVYRKGGTKLRRECEKAGARYIGGERILVHQGARSLEIWLERKPPVGLMMAAVEAELELR